MQGTAVIEVFAFLLFLTELSLWNLSPFEGRGSVSKPSPRGSFLSCPDTDSALQINLLLLISGSQVLAELWCPSFHMHLLPRSWTLLLTHHLFLQSSHHLFLLRFTFSSPLCPISVFSSSAFQSGHTPSPCSDSELISSVPECPITFSTPISPFLCLPSCPRPTAVHSQLPKREQSSSSQLNQLRYHRKACGKAHVENSQNTGKKSYQKGARKPEHKSNFKKKQQRKETFHQSTDTNTLNLTHRKKK